LISQASNSKIKIEVNQDVSYSDSAHVHIAHMWEKGLIKLKLIKLKIVFIFNCDWINDRKSFLLN